MTNYLKRRIQVAKGKKPADIIIRNAQIFNVFTGEFENGDVAIVDGYIVSLYECFDGLEEIDLKGKLLIPGFIDAHVHIESSMVSPKEFSKILTRCGVTTIIADPHEIANVMGKEGIEYMLKASEGLPVDMMFMLPSCVPATPFENSGAILNAHDLEEFALRERVLGLGEVMDYVGVVEGKDYVLDKLAPWQGGLIDGHAPDIGLEDLKAYISAGVMTEHECTSVEDMKRKIRLGMYVLIREGSAAKNMTTLIKGVNDFSYRRTMFCTDDRHPKDLIEEGSIDNCLRIAVRNGLSLERALLMSSYNAAECYRLYDRGRISPGAIADLCVLNGIDDLRVSMTIKLGKVVYDSSKTNAKSEGLSQGFKSIINIGDIKLKDFGLPLKSDIVNTIRIIPRSIVTHKEKRKVDLVDGFFSQNPNLDIVKVAVIERHKGTNNIGLALVENFGIKGGALASSVAHDSHNIIVIGDNDEDMYRATLKVKDMGGGLVIASGGEILESLPLPIAGLMSELTIEEVQRSLETLRQLAFRLGVNQEIDPFMTLAFIALPVIPHIKITDLGLFDVDRFEFIDVSL